MSETLRVPALTRELVLDGTIEIRAGKDKHKRLRFTGSSETPVSRFFGDEILDHGEGSIRLDRVTAGAVPILFNHDMNDVLGMVDSAELVDLRLVVESHLFDNERAAEIATMIEGGLRNVSVRYRIHEALELKNGDTRVVDWEPLEFSVVSIPADASVGIGRSADETLFDVRRSRAPDEPAATIPPAANTPPEANTMTTTPNAPAGEPTVEPSTPQVDPQRSEPQAPAAPAAPAPAAPVHVTPNAPPDFEGMRIRAIDSIVKANKIDDQTRNYWVQSGIEIDGVGDDLLRILEQRGKDNPQSVSQLGLSEQETQRYSLIRAIRAAATNDWKAAGYELDCTREIAKLKGTAPDPNKFYVPFEVQQRSLGGADLAAAQQRDLTVATAGAGGFLVATENLGFIDILRNRSVAFQMGAQRLSGLVDSITIPRQSAAATPVWLANEASQATESQQTFVQLAMSPKTVGAYTEISRQLLLQSSPGIEGIVTADLASVAAIAVDLAVLDGSGAAGQPEGIINATGIGTVTGTSIDYAAVLEFQEDVAASNVMPVRGGYVTTPPVASLLMQRVKFTSTASPLWDGSIWNGSMAGFPSMSSVQVPTADMIFGDWNEVIVGEWGVLEVEVNPFANFQAGIIGVRAMYSVDVGIRRPFAFSLATSIT